MWKGFQEIGGVHHNFVIQRFHFKVGESIKGSGKDEKGKYEVKGKIDHDYTLHFKIDYKKKHSVSYMGRLNQHGDKIVGTFEDFGQTGNFEILVFII